jgi:nucleoside-diphosphate-sugar epimerase
MNIFVTGATGFIGSHLVRRLVRDDHKITVYVRKSSSLKYLPKKKIKIIYGDIKDGDRLKEVIKGFDVVYHNAALVSDWATKTDFYRTNLDGTINILRAIKKNNIKKLILTSTIGVIGEEDCILAKDEISPYKPRLRYFLCDFFESDMNHYRISKMLAEKESIEFCKKYDIALTVIRPVWVYGPREFHSGGYYSCLTILRGLPVFPVGKTNRFHVVYVGDLTEAMVTVLQKDLKGINIFIIGNENPPLAKEYLQIYCKHLGVDMPTSLPEVFFQPLGFILEAIYKLFRIKKSPILTRARAKMFYCNNIYNISKAKQELNFVSSTSLQEGIKKTVRWWKQNGFLKS